jgi:acetyltransferase-like isoleucine patch superfamily enzyme
VKFGTEPWIITIGNNVHITDGVKFITHDGGTLLFRKYVPDLETTKPIVVGDSLV